MCKCLAVMGSSIWRPHTPYGRFWNPNQNQCFNIPDPDLNSTGYYDKKLRKILESKPKSTVALKIVINPAGIIHGAGYIFLLDLIVCSTEMVTLLPSSIGGCGLQME